MKIYERHLAREIYATTGLVLLAFLIAMNAIAIFVRRRFERRW